MKQPDAIQLISAFSNPNHLPSTKRHYGELVRLLIEGPKSKDELANRLGIKPRSVPAMLGRITRRIRRLTGDQSSAVGLLVERRGGLYHLLPAGHQASAVLVP